MRKIGIGLALLLVAGTGIVMAQAPQNDAFIYGDPRPDAPELAARGDFKVGVRTLELVNPDQIDIMNYSAENPAPRYDRSLTIEVWYPALIPPDAQELTNYDEWLGSAADPNRPLVPFTFPGRALRDAEPDSAGAPYPLIIVSHGYPGSRYQLTYLTENLASKGYVVVAIDHTDSNFDDVTPTSTASALLNRAPDILFVLDQMADSFLGTAVDTNNTGLIGYSFGGYGVLNALGAGVNEITAGMGAPGGLLAARQEGNFTAQDNRIKAAVLFAPYGGDLTLAGLPGFSFWDQTAFQDITIPTFWVIGTLDDVSIYDGVLDLFVWTINSDRYLLTYENARHNVAPNPPPNIPLPITEFERYSEPSWDMRRLNNINQHFVTAFFGVQLKGLDYAPYLDVPVVVASEGVYSVDAAGNFTSQHTYWRGFSPRSAVGMQLKFMAAQE